MSLHSGFRRICGNIPRNTQ